MKKPLILIMLLAIMSACSSDNDMDSKVQIRLANVSSLDYKNIVVNTSTGNVNFEDLNAGQISDYKSFDLAYRYAFVELEINGETYTIQPIDYVGETPLENGKYTYQIDANESLEKFGKLSISLVED